MRLLQESTPWSHLLALGVLLFALVAPVDTSTTAFPMCPLFLEKDMAGGRYFG